MLKGRPRPSHDSKLLRQAFGSTRANGLLRGLTVQQRLCRVADWTEYLTKEAPNCIAQRESIDIDPDIAPICTSCPYVDFCIAHKVRVALVRGAGFSPSHSTGTIRGSFGLSQIAALWLLTP